MPSSYRKQKPRQNWAVRRSTREVYVKVYVGGICERLDQGEPSNPNTLVWQPEEERGKETGLGRKSLRW